MGIGIKGWTALVPTAPRLEHIEGKQQAAHWPQQHPELGGLGPLALARPMGLTELHGLRARSDRQTAVAHSETDRSSFVSCLIPARFAKVNILEKRNI